MYDVIIPVYRPGKEFFHLLRALGAQTLKPDKLIIVESVDDGRGSGLFGLEAPEGIEMVKLIISSGDFDHGGTRNLGINESFGDYFVCLTQDAVPSGPKTMELLLEPLIKGEAAMSYARQVPSKSANIRERLTRRFNYPDTPVIKTAADVKSLGIKTYFASNSCAAYNRKVFDELGGFCAPAIFNEDMVYAHSLINAGHSIAYAAGARVTHSHNYSHREDFKRSFDLGVSQAMHPEVFEGISSESEGVNYIITLAKRFTKMGRPQATIPLISHAGVRYLGYRTGKSYKHLPDFVIRSCSMNKNFWK